MNQRINIFMGLLVIIFLTALIFGGVWWKINRGLSCPADAKQCPNGQYVGRVGQNCEFAPCPEDKITDMSDWKTYTNDQFGYEIKYPQDLKLEIPKEEIFLSRPMKQRADLYSGSSLMITVVVFPLDYVEKYDQSKPEEHKKITLNGIEADRIDELTDVTYFSTTTIRGTRYQYKIAYTDSLDHPFLEKYEKLLESFKLKEGLVGNDKDEHGCIGSAGYQWCEEKQKCLRVWEEKCEI